MSIVTATRVKRLSRRLARAKRVSGVERERAVMYGSIKRRPVLVAGMVKTAVMTSIDVQRARDPTKQAPTKSQLEARIAKTLTKYQAKMVQSIDMEVNLAVHARIMAKSERWPWERKNSGANG
jgi:hypothetical protein